MPQAGRRTVVGTLVVSLAAVVAACSSDGDSAVSGASLNVTATATAGVQAPSLAGTGGAAVSDTAGLSPAVAGSEIVATYGELGPTTALPPNPGTVGTAGSGCRPGNAATLPDGMWLMRLVGVSVSGPATAALDLVCYSTTQSLAAAGSSRVVEGFAIDNDNPLTRDVPLGGEVSFHLQQPPPPTVVGQETARLAFSAEQRGELQAWLQRHGPVLAWVQVRGSVVTEVYAPPLTTA